MNKTYKQANMKILVPNMYKEMEKERKEVKESLIEKLAKTLDTL